MISRAQEDREAGQKGRVTDLERDERLASVFFRSCAIYKHGIMQQRIVVDQGEFGYGYQ